MSKKIISKPLTVALGAALVGGLTAAAANAEVDADENPFAMEELSGQLMAGAHSGGGDDDSDSEGEGSCGEGEGSCGEGKDEGEGSCGEGKCGGSA
jgi:uncharacterized low-complexity protein